MKRKRDQRKTSMKLGIVLLAVLSIIIGLGMVVIVHRFATQDEMQQAEVQEEQAVGVPIEIQLDDEKQDETQDAAQETVEQDVDGELMAEIQAYVDTMTTEEKIGQLFMMDFRTDSSGNNITTLTSSVAAQIEEYHLGGVILFSENIDTEDQTSQLIADMQSVADIPLLIGVDEEGGVVTRLGNSSIDYEVTPAAGEIASNEEAASTATTIGEALKELGFNVDFAPVADVNTNPANTVIGTRAYSDDAEIAAERVAAFVEALQDTGIAGAAKHFPGHGDTTTDSHYGTASVDHDLERLETVEFLPFESAIDAGVDMILMGHIIASNVTGDDIPASLNPVMVDILREDLGFDGVIITDAMNMGAIVDYYGVGESAVMAIEAGVDIVLMPSSLSTAYTAVEEAVANGRITEENLNDSVMRVLYLKYELGIME